jgi:predicted DNA-binding transcriptional regulator AlpA
MEPTTKLIYEDLKSRYNRAVISKKDLAKELGVSLSTIDNYIHRGYGIPPYKKLGTANNARVVFNIVDVASFLAQTIKTA